DVDERRQDRPDWFVVPAWTSAPVTFSTGSDSPVIDDWSTKECPSSTMPSTGIRAPGFTTIRSPTWTSSVSTSWARPSRTLSVRRDQGDGHRELHRHPPLAQVASGLREDGIPSQECGQGARRDHVGSSEDGGDVVDAR